MPGRDNPVSLDARGEVTPSGGTVASSRGELTVSLPAGAVTSVHTLVVRDRGFPTLTRQGGSKVRPLVAFDVELTDAAGRKASGQLGREATITLDFAEIDLGNIVPQSLTFFTLDEATGRWQAVPGQLDYNGKKMVARTSHFSGWAVGGDTSASIVPNVEAAQTSLFTRSAEMAIELKLPPGLAGLVPRLVLKYSSAAVNRSEVNDFWSYMDVQGSWVGLGWSLDLGAITARHKDTGYELFAISLGGIVDRILRKNTQPLTEDWYSQRESFAKIEHIVGDAEHWWVTTKDGTKYRFGYIAGEGGDAMGDPTNTGSRQESGYIFDNGPRTYNYRWLLDRIEDTNGNVVTIEYEGTRASISAGGATTDMSIES
ncbi:MAG: hypothetical protein HY675_20340 [Chloroflexi bacterium]|nr:hypothetical protein [Chloroflexota bacterium]